MSGEIKIKKLNEITVAEYMNVINNPQATNLSEQDQVILDKFREAAKSHYFYRADNGWESETWINKPRNISYAWGSFNAILVVFQYLNDNRKNVQEALNLTALFKRFEKDTKANEPNKKHLGEYAKQFIFRAEEYMSSHTSATFEAKVEVQNTDYSPDAYKENFNNILGSCTKDSTISEVLRQLESYVRPVAMAGFREMARRGFDVDFSTSQDMAEQESTLTTQSNGADADISPRQKKLDGRLWAKCEQLYDAGARQIVFTGAPGTGKTYTAGVFAQYKLQEYADKHPQEWGEQSRDEHIKTVQFHSGYDYSDFVEGLRPAPTGKNGEMAFVRLDGHFKEFCRSIPENGDPNIPYFFIIDEINRADLSRVFGELMFCLDESKRPCAEEGKPAQRITTQYSKLPTYQVVNGRAEVMTADEDKYQDGFYIPENLCILATMNDIDRSVESFDFALRRRFKWIRADANEEMQSGLMGMLRGRGISEDDINDLAVNVKNMNSVITGSYGEKLRLTEDYHIGHAYFEKYDGTNLEDIWNTQIDQILREYCRGRSDSVTVANFIQSCHDTLSGIKN